MSKYWIVTVSKDHVLKGIEWGIVQACHGKKAPLARMKSGDGFAFYSPKIAFQSQEKCQAFTGVGIIKTGEVYQADMGGGFKPFRVDAQFFKECKDATLSSFPVDKDRWVKKFRFGHFEVSEQDFLLITFRMGLNENNIKEEQKQFIS